MPLALLAFARSPLGRYVLAGLAIVVLLASIYGVGQHKGAEGVRKAAVADAAKTDARTAKVSTEAAQSIATERVRVQTVTKTLIQKVPIYVPAAADAACVVNSGVVQLLDGAAQVPSAARGPVEGPSGVPLSAVTETVVANYGVAYDWRAEALGWRDWYAREAAAWGKR